MRKLKAFVLWSMGDLDGDRGKSYLQLPRNSQIVATTISHRGILLWAAIPDAPEVPSDMRVFHLVREGQTFSDSRTIHDVVGSFVTHNGYAYLVVEEVAAIQTKETCNADILHYPHG